MNSKNMTGNAIIVSAVDWSAKDRILTLQTEHSGKIRAINYNAKLLSNKHNGALQLFNTVAFHADTKHGLPAIRQVEIVTSRRLLRENFDRFPHAAFIAELSDTVIHERDGSPKFFNLLSDCFDIITRRNPRISALIAALKIIDYAGFRPTLDSCLICGATTTNTVSFEHVDGGIICAHCQTKGQSTAEFRSTELLHKFLTIDLKHTSEFTVSASLLRHSEAILHSYIAHHIDNNLKSLNFLAATSCQ